MSQRRAGIIQVAVNGEIYDAKGDFTYNLGANKREAILGADQVHGFKESVQAAYIEGEITDRGDLNVEALLNAEDVTVTLRLANGKTIALTQGWYAGDGDIGTTEANIQVRFEGNKAEEISA